MTVKEIVFACLKEHGYDGLRSDYDNCDEDPCGCTLKDFMPCEECAITGCVAAYEYNPVKDAEIDCPDFEKCEELGGCFYDASFDGILSEEDRQCACRREKEG
jgi:hypothetical protein